MCIRDRVSEIKKRYDVTLHLHCHATTGMAEMALLKAIEAGVDGVDTAISSMSATYGHPATEALVATLAGTPYDTSYTHLDVYKRQVGYRSLECWGGATFDACIRFLGEDPWVRLRELKKAMPKTPLQMLLRGQNLLGYRHYA
ncbi:oxaloacetate decarboxylase alpha chain, partial [Klebsiella pneumoniae]